MTAVEGKGLSALVRKSKNTSVNRKKRGMKESKLNHIGIVLSSDIVGMKV